jgi:uncharacterized protein
VSERGIDIHELKATAVNAIFLPVLIVTLTFELASPSLAAGYAPLDCARAASPSETAICSNYRLGQDEARMATLYQWATSLVAMGQRGTLQDEQAAFLKDRAGCGADVTCIGQLYEARIDQLEAVLKRIQHHGPF